MFLQRKAIHRKPCLSTASFAGWRFCMHPRVCLGSHQNTRFRLALQDHEAKKKATPRDGLFKVLLALIISGKYQNQP